MPCGITDLLVDVPAENGQTEEEHTQPDTRFVDDLLRTSALHNIGSTPSAKGGRKAGSSVLQHYGEYKQHGNDCMYNMKHNESLRRSVCACNSVVHFCGFPSGNSGTLNRNPYTTSQGVVSFHLRPPRRTTADRQLVVKSVWKNSKKSLYSKPSGG